MEFKETKLKGVYIITPKVFGDTRGFFMETYNKNVFAEAGIDIEWVQDNHSKSSKDTLRGIHYQLPPYTQDKLVSVTEGAVLDVAVDLHRDSPTFGQHVAVELNSENKQMLLVPKGYGHGFVALTEVVYFQYKVSDFYAPDHDRGIAWNDPDLNISWGVDDPILSEKDSKHPRLSEIPEKDLF